MMNIRTASDRRVLDAGDVTRAIVQCVVMSVLLALVGCATSDCVYRCSFDGDEALQTVSGGAKVRSGAGLEYVEGVKGNALCVSAGTVPVRVDFDQGLPVEKGSISYWAKIEDPSRDFRRNTYFLSFNGWHMMHRISTNTGEGTSGWQASIAGFHLFSFNGCGSRSYESLFHKGADPKAWHKYEFVWNTNGIHGAESKIVQYRIDGREVLSASKSEFNPSRFVSHLNTCKNMMIGGADRDVTTQPFLIDELEIRATDIAE